MSGIEVTDLHKSFEGRPPVRALRGLSVVAPAGELTAVLGPSGCGKTTLLRVVAGFERADAGCVRVGDRLVVGPGTFVPPERRAVGIVPQEGALFPHLDVAANIGFGLARASRADRRARVGDLLDLVGLAGHERRRPHELSGGQQQRVALARALAPRPDVVLLDEPFTALDAGLRAGVREQVADLLTSTGTTAVLVTHDQVEAFSLASTVAVVRDGATVQVGSPHDLYRHPADLETARFVGEAVTLDGTVSGDRVVCALGEVPIDPSSPAGRPVTGAVTVMVRPEQLVADASSPHLAEVRAVRFAGQATVVQLVLDDVELRARWVGDVAARRGDRIGIAVAGFVAVYPPLQSPG